jgi:acyl carrier protein
LARPVRLTPATTRTHQESPRLWFLTRGAREHVPSQAALSAFVKVMPIEQLPLWGGTIDADRATPPASAALSILDIVLSGAREDQTAIAGRRTLAVRLVPQVDEARAARDWSCRAGDAYLVTGGYGGVGLEAARWLASRGATHLVIAGRTRHDEAARTLEAEGVTVEAVSLDVADRAALTAWLADRSRRGAPPIRGIVHAAGVWHDRPIAELDADSLHRVLAPKIDGTLALDAAFVAGSLDFFVAFSAFSSLLPAEGQANYAAANAFMDAVVGRRRAGGERALSINWGPWSDVGFAATDYGRRAHQRLTALGIVRLSPERGRAWLDRLVSEDWPRAAVMPVDWPTLFAADPNARLSPFLSELAGAGTDATVADAQAAGRLASEIVHLDSRAQLAHLESALTTIVSGVMRVDAAEIDRAADLGTLGLDSLMAVEIKNRLQHDTGVTVPLVQLLEGISVAALADVLLTRLKVALLAAPRQSPDSTGSLEEIEI